MQTALQGSFAIGLLIAAFGLVYFVDGFRLFF